MFQKYFSWNLNLFWFFALQETDILLLKYWRKLKLSKIIGGIFEFDYLIFLRYRKQIYYCRIIEGNFTWNRHVYLAGNLIFFFITGNGYITVEVLKEILREIDTSLDEYSLEQIIDEVDEDGSGTVDFDEFMAMMTGEWFFTNKSHFFNKKSPILSDSLHIFVFGFNANQ